jgi:hypothetical protein
MYKSNPGLRAHKKKCKAPEPVISTAIDPVNTDLHAEIVSLKGMILELVKNQNSEKLRQNYYYRF